MPSVKRVCVSVCGVLCTGKVGERGGGSATEKAESCISLSLLNKSLIMAGASGLKECVCFLLVVVNVIECSCRAFLHRALCLGKVQFSQDMLT